MSAIDPLSVPVTALERKIVSAICWLDVVDQAQILVIATALREDAITALDTAEAIELGRAAITDLALLAWSDMPAGAKAA